MNKLIPVVVLMMGSLFVAPYTLAYEDESPRTYDRAEYPDQGERKVRNERRGQSFQWKTGYKMPQHYRGDGYKVDFKQQNLTPPGRNQQWYKIRGEYVLIDTSSHTIIKTRN